MELYIIKSSSTNFYDSSKRKYYISNYDNTNYGKKTPCVPFNLAIFKDFKQSIFSLILILSYIP